MSGAGLSFDAAGAHNQPSCDLLTQRKQVAEKTAWMLRSLLASANDFFAERSERALVPEPESSSLAVRLHVSAQMIRSSILTEKLLFTISVALLAGCDNYIIQAEQETGTAWANVQTQLQRRADLVPNLVETVKGAAAHEKGTLEAVIAARNTAVAVQLTADDLAKPEKMAALQRAQSGLSQALRQVFALSESYPEIRANQNFRDLQVQIEGTENRIARSREEYNSAVQGYNAAILKWPGRWIAGGRQPKQPFEAEASAASAPHVKF